MAADDGSEPVVRFKRRKTQPHKRVRLDDAPASTPTQPTIAVTAADARDSPASSETHLLSADADESVPNLREILRARKHPRDRLREAARRAESKKSVALVPVDAPKPDQYSTRFVAQTGQVVDQDDKQMMEYVEARTAEKNHRLYGWPIPTHLQHVVATMIPTAEQSAVSTKSKEVASRITKKAEESAEGTNTGYTNRLAVGMGKLQEIDLGPEATARNIQLTEEAWRRLEGGQADIPKVEPPAKVRLGKDGKPRRNRNQRNSEDLRRDMLVEEVMHEAKLDFFEEDKPSSPPADGNSNTDEAMVEQFRREFLESMEPRIQKKPAVLPGPKGAKEPPKGPKLGGSRSARAAMRLQEEQAAKNKRDFRETQNKMLERFRPADVPKYAWYTKH